MIDIGNFIKIDRKILDWEWWSDINTYRLFTYMLLKANWKDGSFKGVDVPRGSFVSSISKLSVETNLTVDEVRTALKHLKSTKEITSKSRSKFTVFTVNNYNLYQGNPEQLPEQIPSNSQADTKQAPSTSHPIPDLFPTIEEGKNTRKEEDDSPPLTPPQGEETKKETQKQTVDRLLHEISISDYLLEFVNDWLTYKKERNFTYKVTSLKTLLKKISENAKKYGDEVVANIISESMANGYQGIVWDRLDKQSRGSGGNASPEGKQKRNQFNSFSQRNRTVDETDKLEKMLLEQGGELKGS